MVKFGMDIKELISKIKKKKDYEDAEFFIKYNEKLGRDLLFSVINCNPALNRYFNDTGCKCEDNWYTIDVYDPGAKRPMYKVALLNVICDYAKDDGKSLKFGEICMFCTAEYETTLFETGRQQKSFYQGKGISRDLLNLAQYVIFQKEQIRLLTANIVPCGCYDMSELLEIYINLGFEPQIKLQIPANEYRQVPTYKVCEPCELNDIGFIAINTQDNDKLPVK